MEAPWFSRASAALTAVTRGPTLGDVDLDSLLRAVAVVAEGYAILYGNGHVGALLRGDLLSQARELRGAVDAYLLAVEPIATAGTSQAPPSSPLPPPPPSVTLSALTAWEVARVGGPEVATRAPTPQLPRPPMPGTRAALWLTRTLRFIEVLLTHLAGPGALSISRAGALTYAEVLKPYHAFVMSWIVSVALAWAPSRAAAVAQLRISDAEACTGCMEVATALAPLTQSMGEHLRSEQLDFPDKVSSVPGGW